MSEHSFPTVCVSISSFLKLLMILSLDTWFCLDEGTLWSPMISFFQKNKIGKKKMSLLIKECSLIRYSDTLWWSEMCQALIKMLATLSLMVHVPLLKRSVPSSSDWPLVSHLTFWLVSEWRDANIYWWEPWSFLSGRYCRSQYDGYRSRIDHRG